MEIDDVTGTGDQFDRSGLFRAFPGYVPVKQLDDFHVRLSIAGRYQGRANTADLQAEIKKSQNNGDPGTIGDMIETCFSVTGPGPGAFGRDDQDQFVGGFKAAD